MDLEAPSTAGGGGQKPSLQPKSKLNGDGCWRNSLNPHPIGEKLERDQLQHVLDMKEERIVELERQIVGIADSGSVAVSALVRVIGDVSVTARRKLRAASAILSFKVEDESVTAFAVNYLETICASSDAHIDHKIEAGRLLQQFQNPRVAQRTEYLSARPDPEPDPEEARRQRDEETRRKYEHLARMDILIRAEVGLPASPILPRNGD
jgi:hypothetical protein